MTDPIKDQFLPPKLRMVPAVVQVMTSETFLAREPDSALQQGRLDLPFTRSNGTILAKLYERLTKASRRREPDYKRLITIPGGIEDRERAYRQGVYDAFKALQQELSQ